MAGIGGVSSNRNGNGAVPAASINDAVNAAGASETRFPAREPQRRWGNCLFGLSCFGSHKRGKRIAPTTRIQDGSLSGNRGNGPQPGGISIQATGLTPSLLAPPSSPASFTNSALPSTAQSPNNFLSLSANVCSPGGPSSTMFITGPYAHETQLVSPPVFSTFTTEPSTAPLTPPPELSYLTTPSSPDVPFAKLLSSSLEIKNTGKENRTRAPYEASGYVSVNDLQATYQLYPGSPASHLVSPKSGLSTNGMSSPYPEMEFPSHWSALISAQDTLSGKNGASRLFGNGVIGSRNFMMPQDSSLFFPAASAQFSLDQAQQSHSTYPHCNGRISFSKEAGHGKACKTDVEEIEAYRASFGFSADEIISTAHYVELPDVDFTMIPFATSKPYTKELLSSDARSNIEGKQTMIGSPKSKSEGGRVASHGCADHGSRKQVEEVQSSSSSPTAAIAANEVFPLSKQVDTATVERVRDNGAGREGEIRMC